MASTEKIIYEQEGVFIHTTIARADEDALVAGALYLKEQQEGVFCEWLPVGRKDGSPSEKEWAIVTTDAKHVENTSIGEKLPKHKYILNFNLRDLRSLKRSRPNLGWSYLIFIKEDGSTYPALHFHQGGTKSFIKEIERYLVIKKSPTDSCLFLVHQHDPTALSKSFDELQLFDHQPQSHDVITKFINNPYSSTLTGFSKVTRFLQDTFIAPDPADDRAIELLKTQPPLDIFSTDNEKEPGYELVERTEPLPPRPEVTRLAPIGARDWSSSMDNEGRVINVQQLLKNIFRRGVDPSIRIEVWKFLLGFYSWDSTYKIRTAERRNKVDDYFRMKLQWKSISEAQEKRFGLLRDRKNLIEKDVMRTDRTLPFYAGPENPNVQVLYDILMTYCMYNFDLGYVQGMSDLLSPILVVMENDTDAFWCFAGSMELLVLCEFLAEPSAVVLLQHRNFEEDQSGMKQQLMHLQQLVKYMDPELSNYLESNESSNMYFCFRWLLILFKREFSFTDIMRLWEVYWTGEPCRNFHLLICLAILDSTKHVLIENNFGFTEILKHINDLSGSIDVDLTLKKAEGMYLQLKQATVPTFITELFF